MNRNNITESEIEQATIEWFKELRYSVLFGPDISPGRGEVISPLQERASYSDVILENRLHSALIKINPDIPGEAIEDAYWKLTRAIHESPPLAANNHRFHKMLTEGIDVEYQDETGRIIGDKVWLVDFDNPDNNSKLSARPHIHPGQRIH